MTARISFDHEMKLLNENLIEMGRCIEQAIEKSIAALESQDYVLAREIIAGDRNINDMERSIESRCLSLILRQQPVARDLRVVSTALKVVTDMERIGDHAADIAELILRIKGDHVYHIIKDIPPMAEVAKQMVGDSVNAFITCDLADAKAIIARDDEVDDLFNKVKLDVIELMKNQPEHADICIDVLMIAKYLERIGDHAVNICEWTEFHETGSLNNVKII